MMTRPMEAKRAQEIFSASLFASAKKIDQIFGFLFVGQWIGGVLLAYFISPLTWVGGESKLHVHVLAAIFFGGLLASFPLYLIVTQPGKALNRYTNTIAQTLFTGLFIHLTMGRIETHFHVFGSLAFLAFYRDWRVLLLATFLATFDHLVRGYFWPVSTYGVLSAGSLRALEHAAWILFEDTVLFFSINNGLKELWSLSEKQTQLERTIASVEDTVTERTRELSVSRQTIIEQQQALLSVAKMSALGEMAGGVAHEINNPLAIIKAVSSQLEDVMSDEEMDKELVIRMSSTISSTADRIAKIVLGLRTFSRDGTQDPFLPVNVSNLIESTVGLCSERFRNHSVDLQVEAVPKHLTFEGRETQISQVLLNLLNNSYDAISDHQKKWIRISVKEGQEEVKIIVTDSGNGVPLENQKKIFQPFFTTKEIGKGTGMGLSISHGIAQSHKGELFVDQLSPNTCFVLRLPKKYVSGIKAA